MKVNIKKVAVGVMATAMMATCALPVLAAPVNQGTTNITISGTGSGYDGYRVLNLTSALKADCGHEGEANASEHDATCYNYSYTVNAKYGEAVRDAAENAGLNFDEDSDGTVTDRELIKGLNGMSATETRDFADELWGQISDMSADETATDKVFSDVPQGWYLIAESALDGSEEAPDARSLVMLDTAGRQEVTVASKEGVPTLDKKILVADAEAEDGFKRVTSIETAAHDLDTITYELKVTMPDNVENFAGYSFVIHDKDTGIKFDDEAVGAIKVKVGGTELTGLAKTEGVEDGCSFHIDSEDILNAMGEDAKFTQDTVITVLCETTVDSDYNTDSTGNTNTAHLEFTNDPYDLSSKANTPEKKTAVFTYKLLVNKVDAEGEALRNAEFTLYKMGEDGEYAEYMEITNEDGELTTFDFSGLCSGTYKLVETQVPDGYNKADDIVFVVEATFDENSETPATTNLVVKDVDGNIISGEGATFSANYLVGTVGTDVVNTTGLKMPSTGGTGTVALYCIGACVAIACVGGFVLTKKKGTEVTGK